MTFSVEVGFLFEHVRKKSRIFSLLEKRDSSQSFESFSLNVKPPPSEKNEGWRFWFLVVFISTCLVTVTPQCILFSEMVKKDSYKNLKSATPLWGASSPFVPYARVLPLCTRAIFLLYLSPRVIRSRFLVLPFLWGYVPPLHALAAFLPPCVYNSV